MSSRPANYVRLNSDIDAVDPLKLRELINSIDQRTITRLLITAAKTYPDVSSLVRQEVNSIAVPQLSVLKS